jgi:preprotein translocase subunit SecE
MATGSKVKIPGKALFERIAKFFRESRNELKKVHWPTRKELVAFTTVVIIITVVVSLFAGVFDIIVAEILVLLKKLGG